MFNNQYKDDKLHMKLIKENDYVVKYIFNEHKIDTNAKIQSINIATVTNNIYIYRDNLIIMPASYVWDYPNFVIPNYKLYVDSFEKQNIFYQTYYQHKFLYIKNNVIHCIYVHKNNYLNKYRNKKSTYNEYLYSIDLNKFNTTRFSCPALSTKTMYVYNENYRVLEGGYFDGSLYFMLIHRDYDDIVGNNIIFFNNDTSEKYTKDEFLDLIKSKRPSYIHNEFDDFDNFFAFTHKQSIHKINVHNYSTFHMKYKNIIKTLFLIKCKCRKEYKMVIPRDIIFMICDMMILWQMYEIN